MTTVDSSPRARSRRRGLAVSATLILLTWGTWTGAMVAGGRWHLFADGWPMSLTMALGSFVAGATSEGGGAVAFPVMTLVLGIEPGVARDFSLMIQSVGMTSAAAAILLSGIRVERRAIGWASLGGALGLVIGLEWLADLFVPSYAKMFFTSVWLSFAVALWLINRYHEREVHREIVGFLPRHAAMLVAAGVAGGLVSSITGSGLDITIFALLVLRLRINEKIATPTSVVLMAGNSLTGFLWKGGVRGTLSPEAWDAWWVCVPIVVIGAPIGAWFIERRSRLFVSGILSTAIVVQSVVAFLIVPQSVPLLAFSAAVFLAGTTFFRFLAARGVRRLEWLGAVGAAGGGSPEGGSGVP